MADIRSSGHCKNCRTITEEIFDYTTGDCICTACGLVKDDHDQSVFFIEEREHSKENLEDILKENLKNEVMESRGERDARNLSNGIEEIDRIAENFSINTKIKVRAYEILKDAITNDLYDRADSQRSNPACLLISCMEHGFNLTAREIITCTNGRVTVTGIGVELNLFREHLELDI